MREYKDELDHLECCQISFPPNEFLIFRTHCGYHIIEIHNNMNECIEQCEKCTMTTCNIRNEIFLYLQITNSFVICYLEQISYPSIPKMAYIHDGLRVKLIRDYFSF